MKRNVCGVLRRKLCRTPISPFISANITLRSMHYPSAAQRRLAFQQFLNRESAPFVGHDVSGEGAGEAINHCHTEVEDRKVEHNVRRRHVLDLVEVRPLQGKLEEGEEFNENERWETRPGNATREGSQPHKGRRNDQYTRRGCDIDPQQRGARDLLSLQQRAAHAVRNAKNKKLVEECRRAAMTLREIHAALQGSTTVANANACSGNNGSAVPCTGGTTEGRIVPSEAVRFQRLHQLRDTTYHLTAEHFAQFPQGFVLDFLDTIGRIVSLVGDPNMTGHGHVVRQAVRSLFMRRYAQSYPDFTSKPPGRKSRSPGSSAQAQCETLLPIHYFRLLRSTLSLPPADSLKIRGPLGTAVPVEEFCVRQLYTANNNGACSSASSAAYSLQQLGPARAVRVVSWCMRCGLSSSHPTAQGSTWISSSSTLPPVSDLRIPFGVGKEYTHALLGCFAQPYAENSHESQPPQLLPFSVRELAVLCSAVVYYKISTMEALTVLINAAPQCALHADELSGHELGCVMLAYATLKYHGDLAQHPPLADATGVKQKVEANFFLLLGERACSLGERLHENDAGRVLRALEMTGVEHDVLRDSLMSGMRMKRLRHRVLLSGR